TVNQGGATIINREKDRRFVLTAKGGEVEFHDPETGVRLLTKEFTLERGGRTVVRAREELAAARKARKDGAGGKEKAVAFSLDSLDAAKIPAAERNAMQPKELVAVLGEHRGRHWGRVVGLAYSPDGKFVATAGDGGTALWDSQTLRQRAFLPGSQAAVA